MIELGKKDELLGTELLKSVGINGRPASMPLLDDGHKVICGFDQGLGERMIVCDSLEEMQHLYDKYIEGVACRINWYTGEDPGFIG